MRKIIALLVCVILYCTVRAGVPISIVVQTTDDTSQNFSLTENTKIKFSDKDICIIYPEGEYSIGYDKLKKIEYSEVAGIDTVNKEQSYCFSGNKVTVNAATEDIEVCLYTLGGKVTYLRKVKVSESAVIDFSGFKGIYILRINGTSQKIILK